MNILNLRNAVWKKAIGNEQIANKVHHFRAIRKKILDETGFQVNVDTVRNFMLDRHEPQPQIKDIYATYVLEGTTENPKTFEDFETSLQQQPVLDRISSVLKEGRKGVAIILGFLVEVVTT